MNGPQRSPFLHSFALFTALPENQTLFQNQTPPSKTGYLHSIYSLHAELHGVCNNSNHGGGESSNTNSTSFVLVVENEVTSASIPSSLSHSPHNERYLENMKRYDKHFPSHNLDFFQSNLKSISEARSLDGRQRGTVDTMQGRDDGNWSVGGEEKDEEIKIRREALFGNDASFYWKMSHGKQELEKRILDQSLEMHRLKQENSALKELKDGGYLVMPQN